MRKEIKLNSVEDVEKLADVAAKFHQPVDVCRYSVSINALSFLAVLSLVGKDNVCLVFPHTLPRDELSRELARVGLA